MSMTIETVLSCLAGQIGPVPLGKLAGAIAGLGGWGYGAAHGGKDQQVQKLPINARKRALPDSSKLTVTPAAPIGVGTKMPVVVL